MQKIIKGSRQAVIISAQKTGLKCIFFKLLWFEKQKAYEFYSLGNKFKRCKVGLRWSLIIAEFFGILPVYLTPLFLQF